MAIGAVAKIFLGFLIAALATRTVCFAGSASEILQPKVLKPRALKPKVLSGHSGPVTQLAISPNGRFLVSGGRETALKLWDLDTRRELRSFGGHAGKVTSLAFSPGGEAIFSSDSSGKGYLWSAATGALINDASIGSAFAAVFHPQGGSVLSAGKVYSIMDVGTGSKKDLAGFDIYAKHIAISAKHNRLVIGGRSGEVAFYRWSDYTPQRAEKLDKSVTDMMISDDQKYLAVGSRNGELIVYDLVSLAYIFKQTVSTDIKALTFVGDSNQLAVANRKGNIQVWNISQGKMFREIALGATVDAMLAGGDKPYLVVAGRDGNLSLVDPIYPREPLPLQEYISPALGLSVSPSGLKAVTYINTARNQALYQRWDLKRGGLLDSYPLFGKDDQPTALAIDSTGNRVFYASKGGRVGSEIHGEHIFLLHDVVAGDEPFIDGQIAAQSQGENPRRAHRRAVTDLALVNDGRYLLSASRDARLKLWDANSGELLGAYHAEQPISSIAVHPSGEQIAVGLHWVIGSASYAKIVLLRLSPGGDLRKHKEVLHEQNVFTQVLYSPSGKILALAHPTGFTLLQNGKTSTVEVPRGYRHHIAFTPDEKFLLIGSNRRTAFATNAQPQSTLLYYDLVRRKLVEKSKAHFTDIHGLAALDNQRVVVATETGLSLLTIPAGEPLVRLFGAPDGDWIASTPDGYFASSPEAARSLYYVPAAGFASYAFENFAGVLRTEDVVRQRLAGNVRYRFPAPRVITPPDVVNTSQAPTLDFKESTYPFTGQVSGPRKITTVRAFVNGLPVVAKPVDAREAAVKFAIPLSSSHNRIAVYAFDEAGYASNGEYFDVVRRPESSKLPDLHVLAVGINTYQNAPLDFAVSDAEKMARVFEAQKGSVFANVHATTLTEESATQTNILNGLTAQKTKVTARDLTVIFMAGHGVRHNGEFYFVTYKGSLDSPMANSIEWRDISRLLEAIPGTKLLILDACHAGAIIRGLSVPNDLLAAQMVGEKRGGVIVFTASKGRQQAAENHALGGGEFTLAMLRALGEESAQADLNRNGYVELSELVDYVSARVYRRSRGRQTPWLARRQMFGDFSLARTGPNERTRKTLGY